MLAAEAAYDAIMAGRQHDELTAYPAAFEKSWLHEELNKARNFKDWFKKGLTVATLMNGIEQLLLRGHIPWTLHRDKPDHALPQAGRRVQADRLSQAGRQAHLRPALVGVHLQHQPRGEPARAPDAEGRRGADARSTWPSTPARKRATARPASTSSCRKKAASRGCRSTRRTACTARPATSRTRRRTSCGSRLRAAAGRTTWGCRSLCPCSSRSGRGLPVLLALPPGEGGGEGTGRSIRALRLLEGRSRGVVPAPTHFLLLRQKKVTRPPGRNPGSRPKQRPATIQSKEALPPNPSPEERQPEVRESPDTSTHPTDA